MKMNEKELREFIKTEAVKAINAGEPLDVSMNQKDGLQSSDGAKVSVKQSGKFVTKTKGPGIESSKEATDVKMNQNDSGQGHDEEIAAAAAVKASGKKKSGDFTKGMRDGDFTAKKTPPKEKTTFGDKAKEGMNKMDKEDTSIPKNGAKTYVEAGAADSTGQKASNFSTDAKNEKEKAARIADAIQLPENFKGKKALGTYIMEQARIVANQL